MQIYIITLRKVYLLLNPILIILLVCSLIVELDNVGLMTLYALLLIEHVTLVDGKAM